MMLLMSNQDYRDLRQAGLEVADTRGEELMSQSVTTPDFARKTADFGSDYQDLLRDLSSNDIEYSAARFIGYELTEKTRRAGIDNIDSTLHGIESTVDLSDNWIEKFYNSFDLVDRLHGGFVDDRLSDVDHEWTEEDSIPEFNPSNPYRNRQKALNTFTENDPEEVGKLFSSGIYVMSDEWMALRLGEQVLTLEPEVKDYLSDLGVI